VPDDQHKTLLKIEGDAEGAKRAAKETGRAVEEMGQASESTARKSQVETQKTTTTLEKQTDKTKEGAQRFDDLAKGMGTSEQAANAFREAISRVDPRLAGMLDMGIKGVEVLNFAFSKLGRIMVGLTVGIGAVVAAIKFASSEINKARQAVEDLDAAEERHRVAARQRHAEAAELAGRAGLGPERTPRARELIRWMEDRGMPRAEAGAVAPYAIDEAGELAISRELAMKWAAAVGGGMIEAPKGFTPRQRERDRRYAIRRLARPEIDEAATQRERQQAAETLRMLEGAAAGKEEETRRYFEATTFKTGEELEQEIALFQRQIREGRRRLPDEGPGASLGPMMPALSMFAKGPEPLHPQLRLVRERLRQQREFYQRLSAAEPATAPVPSRSPPSPPSPPRSPAARIPPGVGLFGVGEEPEDQALLAAGGIGEAPPPVQVHNHGVMMFGTDTRFNRVQRMTNP